MLTRRSLLQHLSTGAAFTALAGGYPARFNPPESGQRVAPSVGRLSAQAAPSPIDTWRIASADLDQATSAGSPAAVAGTSSIRRPAMTFGSLIISWVGTPGVGRTERFLARAEVDGAWTAWYTMAVWQHGATGSVRGQHDALGRVDVDTLRLDGRASAFQLRLESSSSDGGQAIRSLTAVAGEPVGLAPTPEGPIAWGRDLDVPRRSQAIQPPPYRWDICSPTSLTMVLGYWGTDLSVMEVAFAVRDRTTGIFGNWPANTAFAASLGLDAWVDRFDSLAPVERDVAADRPVVASLRWRPGELPGAPLNATGGHLIVIRGFTEQGDVIVNDPAAPSEAAVRRILPRAAFERVWLRAGGVVYRIRPFDSWAATCSPETGARLAQLEYDVAG